MDPSETVVVMRCNTVDVNKFMRKTLVLALNPELVNSCETGGSVLQ